MENKFNKTRGQELAEHGLKDMEFETTHKLDFEVADWIPIPGFPAAKDFKRFRVGTCSGLWMATEFSYDILAINNDQPGNGHFEDVLQWFYNSCERDKKKFRILEVWNKALKQHLIKKRKFVAVGMDNVEISYKQIKKLNKINEPTAKHI